MVSGRSESKALAALKDERDNFESLFQAKAEECAELAKANTTLKAQVHVRMYMYMSMIHHTLLNNIKCSV